jgi:photosystem II stability/assembly factor-like uncharacterized protein
MFSPEVGVAMAHMPPTAFGKGIYYVVRTIDGGIKWHVSGRLPTKVTPSQPELLSMAFASPKEGYVSLLGPNHTKYTDNGGRTWSVVSVPGEPNSLSLQGRSLWITSYHCTVRFSTEGRCPTDLSIYKVGDLRPASVRKVPALGHFSTFGDTVPVQATLWSRLGNVGVGSQGGDGPSSDIVVTKDAGRSWNLIKAPCGRIPTGELVMRNVSTWVLYCALDGGMHQGTNELWSTSDSGAIWNLVSQGSEQDLYPTVGNIGSGMMGDLTTSRNGQTLWLLGSVTGIDVSTDGGRQWTGVDLGTNGYPSQIATAGATDAWLPLPGIGLYRTTNGTTWESLADVTHPTNTASPYNFLSPESLLAIAFFNPEHGYGLFEEEQGHACQEFIGSTSDGGATFTSVVRVASCSGSSPIGSSLAFDDHGDGFIFGTTALYVTHDGGSTWAPSPQPGTVLAVQALGLSVWMVETGCPPTTGPQSPCPLRLIESNDGGRTWAPVSVPADPSLNNGLALASIILPTTGGRFPAVRVGSPSR